MFWRRRRGQRGRVLATRFGLNPNSSSLGVDVTFLLVGAAALSVVTPIVAALLRFRWPGGRRGDPEAPHVEPAADQASG